MNTTKTPAEILNVLKEHERVIARLYEVYAMKLPEYNSFWSRLSAEEIQHAGWIDELQTRVEGSEEDFVVERFAIGAV